MNVLYCIPHLYNSGGMERVLCQKINWLMSHTPHHYTVLTTETPPEGKAFSFFRISKYVRLECFDINFDSDYRKPVLFKALCHGLRMLQYKIRLDSYIRLHQIDLCISLGGKEIAFLSQMPCRTIAEFHFAKNHRSQLLLATHNGRIWQLIGRFRDWQLERAVRHVQKIVVLTESDKRDWEAVGCTQVECIPNICSLEHLELPESTASGEKHILLAAGRLHEQKGFDLLLRAWQQIAERHPSWTLRIVGDGPQRAALIAYTHSLGINQRVEIPGPIDDMPAEYAAASCFVLSSRYEGLPLVLIEAMWAGLPCVSFDCPRGPREMLADSRGIIVPNGDVEALARSLDHALTHPEQLATMSLKSREFARRTYSEEAIMPRWKELINEP